MSWNEGSNHLTPTGDHKQLQLVFSWQWSVSLKKMAATELGLFSITPCWSPSLSQTLTSPDLQEFPLPFVLTAHIFSLLFLANLLLPALASLQLYYLYTSFMSTFFHNGHKDAYIIFRIPSHRVGDLPLSWTLVCCQPTGRQGIHKAPQRHSGWGCQGWHS